MRCVSFVLGSHAVGVGATEMMVEVMAVRKVMMMAGEMMVIEMKMVLAVMMAMMHGTVKVVRRR